MKLLITIVQDQDVPGLLEILMENGFSATKLASTGGFLRVGNTTLLIGVDNNKVEGALALIKKTCKKREQNDIVPMIPFGRGSMIPRMDKVTVAGAIVFI